MYEARLNYWRGGGGGGLEKNPFRGKDIMYGYFLELHKVNPFHEIQIAGFILEIGQWGSNGPPSVILGAPFSRKGVPQKVIKLTDGLARCFAAILEHSGQLEKPGLELLQITRCLSGEIMTQTKKRKAIEKVKGYKSSK